MKKTILLCMTLAYSSFFSQGVINIFNYSPFNLHNALYGHSPTNCFPRVTGSNHPIPVLSMTSVSYSSYNTSFLQSPPISTWTVYQPSGASSTQTSGSSPILSVLSTTTTWQSNKFSLDYVTGGSVPYGGESIGFTDCQIFVDYIGPGTNGNPHPFEALWFTSAGETFFVIQ